MKKFFASDMEKVTGTKRTRWVQWRERGWLYGPAVQVAEGHGTRNIWNRLDLYDIALFRKISEMGLSRKTAAYILQQMVGGLGGLHYEVLNNISPTEDVPIEARNNLERAYQSNRRECWERFKYLLYFRLEDRDQGIVKLLSSGKIDFKEIFSRWIPKKPALKYLVKRIEPFSDFDFVHIIDLHKIKKEVDEKIEALARSKEEH